MSVADETGGRAERIRAKAREMQEAADRASDPQERRRLQDKARRLRERSDQVTTKGDHGTNPL
ncbi:MULTISPECIES: DUF6381 family protein [unclassified Streptomyces]|uniref:DUF6381 family protein n=1 Tax=Streptomyces castrisilvae TaxID=3033811 RepID=A0ABY9HC34_9ACTN|nr:MULTISPECIES: DUF6381 family protein [unclassified Streptomyces]MYY04408.1 hypothetical protein [Streptomyces sp. SID4913]WLQ32073.1 DUF6381 family protein [Streptomyces sp. Mut1]